MPVIEPIDATARAANIAAHADFIASMKAEASAQAPTHEIFRVVPVEPTEDEPTEDEPNPEPDMVKVRDWCDLPAPFPTIGGKLLALENETGFAHVAREI